MKGIIVDSSSKLDIERLGCRWAECSGFVEPEDIELYQEICEDRELQVDDITEFFMTGQDDGKCFYFSDIEEGLNAIMEVFPEFEVTDLDINKYPLDYDYRNNR